MIEKRSFDSLGHFQNGWLNAKHHFSLGGHFDKARLGWGAPRVWNDDEIQPGEGFAPHPHRDMEIITYVRKGAITHRDNLRTFATDVSDVDDNMCVYAHTRYFVVVSVSVASPTSP